MALIEESIGADQVELDGISAKIEAAGPNAREILPLLGRRDNLKGRLPQRRQFLAAFRPALGAAIAEAIGPVTDDLVGSIFEARALKGDLSTSHPETADRRDSLATAHATEILDSIRAELDLASKGGIREWDTLFKTVIFNSAAFPAGFVDRLAAAGGAAMIATDPGQWGFLITNCLHGNVRREF